MRYLSKLVPTLVILAFFATLTYALAVETDVGTAESTAAETPTPTATTWPVFSATVEVIPLATRVPVSGTLHVAVSVKPSEGCRFPIYELTLDQDVPAFEYVSPPTAKVGPPVSNPFTYTLTAVNTGTVTFDALVHGERYCGDFWNWMYLGGESEPVLVWLPACRIYLPLILKN